MTVVPGRRDPPASTKSRRQQDLLLPGLDHTDDRLGTDSAE